MEKIYEMANRHKQELIDTFIKPFLPYEWKEGERELVLIDNAVESPLFNIKKIEMAAGVYEAKMFDVSEWGEKGFVLERELYRFDYEQLETIAYFFKAQAQNLH